MPNILLTDYCNRSCPYCFAKEKVALGTKAPRWQMSEEELEVVLGYLEPGRDIVSLLGGEPTLHPRYPAIVRSLVGRGYDLKVFSNGTTPQLREGVAGCPVTAVRVVLNLNPPETYGPEETAELEANFRACGEHLSLSFNIWTPAFDWGYLRETIVKWSLGKIIRIGVSQPIQGVANVFLEESATREVCRKLVAMAEALAPDGISIALDCGFRLCMFTEEERGILAQCGADQHFLCRPILDIGQDLRVWRCFPFSGQASVRLTDFKSLEEIRQHFDQQWSNEQKQGNTPACAECAHFRNETCRGGCFSRTLLRLKARS
jgi:hypothetical protein